MTGHFRLEVVVVHLFVQTDENLRPYFLFDKDAEGVVRARELLDLAAAKKIRKTIFQGFEVLFQTATDRDSAWVNSLAMPAATASPYLAR